MSAIETRVQQCCILTSVVSTITRAILCNLFESHDWKGGVDEGLACRKMNEQVKESQLAKKLEAAGDCPIGIFVGLYVILQTVYSRRE